MRLMLFCRRDGRGGRGCCVRYCGGELGCLSGIIFEEELGRGSLVWLHISNGDVYSRR